MTKECSQYQGLAGQFCTIKSSNIPWIKAGMKVVYADAADFDALMLDTDVVLSRGHGSAAKGHVNLDIGPAALGTVTFDGGRGALKTFHASATVTVTDRGNVERAVALGWDVQLWFRRLNLEPSASRHALNRTLGGTSSERALPPAQ